MLHDVSSFAQKEEAAAAELRFGSHPSTQKERLPLDLQNRRDAIHGYRSAVPRFPPEQVPVQVENSIRNSPA